MLLMSVSAFAQSIDAPLKGDVNEDGIVDVADITAIIAIMKNGGGTIEETEYYWYVGTIPPSDPNNEEQNTGLNKWTSFGSILPTSDIEVVMVDDNYERHNWYVAAPYDANFTLYDGLNSGPDSGWDRSTITIGSVTYDLWTMINQSHQAAVYLHYEEST